MSILHLPHKNEAGQIHVVVEAARGSRIKLKYDPKIEQFTLSRVLVLGVVYPYDWGFIPGTMADDGDPLDAMVLYDAGSWPGVIIPTNPIGVLRVHQVSKDGKREQNDRIIAVPSPDASWNDIAELSERARAELAEFFVVATRLTGKKVEIQGWEGAEAARATIDESAEAYEGAKETQERG